MTDRTSRISLAYPKTQLYNVERRYDCNGANRDSALDSALHGTGPGGAHAQPGWTQCYYYIII